MFASVPTFIGLRYAKAKKGNSFIAFINLFSVIGIALGLTALITVVSVMNGFEAQLKSRILGIMPHIVVDTRNAPTHEVEQLSNIPQVVDVMPFIESEGVLQTGKGLQGVILQGVEPQKMTAQSVIAKHMLFGDLLQLQPQQYGIIIGRALSIRLNLRPGDKARIITSDASVYTPMGRVPSQRMYTVVGIYEVGSEVDDKVVLMHIDDTARLLRSKKQQVSKTRLFLNDAFLFDEVLANITLSSENWRARQGPLFDAVKMEKNMMGLMLLLIIAVAAFNIVSAMVMVVTEKQGDIAILRTQGMTAKGIMKIFMINGFYNGLKGTLFGLLGGLIIILGINPFLSLVDAPIMLGSEGQGLPIDVHWGQIVMLVLLSMLLCFASALYPAYRAVKIEPAKALKYE